MAITTGVTVKRVGHKGAGQLAPGNTAASFAAALATGVDVIEFDVLRHRGRLVLAHSSFDARRRDSLALEAGLAELADLRYSHLTFNVDLKRPGYEAEALLALRVAGLTERCLVSSQFARCLDRVRALDPDVRVGISVGGWLSRRRHRWNRRVLQRISTAIAAGRFDCLMAHHRLVNQDLVTRIGESGGEVYAWTVDCPTVLDRLLGIGVAGITTNDPRLFLTHR
jgi:glycerophosphoryl diester phosphodiesterase